LAKYYAHNVEIRVQVPIPQPLGETWTIRELIWC